MGVTYETMIAYLFIFIVGVLLLIVLATPIKWLFKALINCAIGAGALFAFNFVGQLFDFTLGFNPGSILTVGILGIPGFMLLLFLKVYLF
jgi:inhibitor of the pro-sigma K processing machinery